MLSKALGNRLKSTIPSPSNHSISRRYNFSYAIPNLLAGSAFLDPSKIKSLWLYITSHSFPIKDVVCLCPSMPIETKKFLETVGVTYHHIPVKDFSSPTIQDLESIASIINRAKTNKTHVLIHCTAGLGRTGTVLAAYYAEHFGISSKEAINAIREIRPHSIESKAQENVIAEYVEKVSSHYSSVQTSVQTVSKN